MLKLENLNKQSDPKWKKVADYFLYVASPAIITFFTAMQVTGEFSVKLCFWGVAGTALLTSLIKGLSKFTADESIQ